MPSMSEWPAEGCRGVAVEAARNKQKQRTGVAPNWTSTATGHSMQVHMPTTAAIAPKSNGNNRHPTTKKKNNALNASSAADNRWPQLNKTKLESCARGKTQGIRQSDKVAARTHSDIRHSGKVVARTHSDWKVYSATTNPARRLSTTDWDS